MSVFCGGRPRWLYLFSFLVTSSRISLRAVAVVVVDAIRTCFGAKGGALSDWHAADLLAYACRILVEKANVDPQTLGGVIATCRTAVGEQGVNIARSAVLAAGWPESIPAITIEGSTAGGVFGVQQAAGLIASGACNAFLVAGVEMPSRVPAGASTGTAVGKPYGPGVHRRFAQDGGLLPPGLIAERMARRLGIGRDAMDEWSEVSHMRARQSSDSGSAKGFVVPTPRRPDRVSESDVWCHVDELLAAEVDPRTLKGAFAVDGLITAGNMALPADGSSALLLASESFAAKQGWQPLAVVDEVLTAGNSVLDGDTGAQLVRRVNKGSSQLQIVRVHEDFAVTPLSFGIESGVSHEVINGCGGALAFGDTGGAASLSLIGEVAHAVARQQITGIAVVSGTGDSTGVVQLKP